jgi:hypothetical protein
MFVFRADDDKVPLVHVDPLTEIIWHSWADVDELKPSALSAVCALQGKGVGDEPQLNWATWLPTALLKKVSHWAPVTDAVKTLDGVRNPPDALIS